MIILLTGLPGVGKTEVAKLLARFLPRVLIIRNDEIRAKLFGVQGGVGFREDQVKAIDKEIIKTIKDSISQFEYIILDRVAGDQETRFKFNNLAHDLGLSFVLMEIVAPESLIEGRLNERQKIDPLGVPFSVYLNQKNKYQPVAGGDYKIINDKSLIELEAEVNKIAKRLLRV